MAVTDFGKKYASTFQKRKEEGQLKQGQRRETTVADEALKQRVAQSVESGRQAKEAFDNAQKRRAFVRSLGSSDAQREYNLSRISSLMEADRQRRSEERTDNSAALAALQERMGKTETNGDTSSASYEAPSSRGEGLPAFKRQSAAGNSRFAQAEATGEYNPYEDALAAMQERLREQAEKRAQEQANAPKLNELLGNAPTISEGTRMDQNAIAQRMAAEQIKNDEEKRAEYEAENEKPEESAADAFNAGEWAAANAKAGWTQIGGRAMQAVNAMLEPAQAAGADLFDWTLRKMRGDDFADLFKETIEAEKEKPALGALYNWAVDPMEKATEAAQTINEQGGAAAEIGGSVIQNAVNMIPNAITSLLSGGTSTALDAFNRAQQTFGGAVLESARQMATSPNFLLSFGQMYGGRYEDAVNEGADPYTAALTATLTTLMNAAVEQGGGVEDLPFTKATVGDWIKNALDEGKEEVIQQVIDQIGQKAYVDSSIPWYSAEDERAVINPKVLGENALVGAIAGGVIGGPGMAVNNIVNQNTQEQAEDFSGAPRMSEIAMELAQEENARKLDKSGRYAQMSGQEISRLAQEAADAEIAEETGETTAQSAPTPHPSVAQTLSPRGEGYSAEVREAAQKIEDAQQKRQFVQAAEKYGDAALVFASNYEGGDIEAYDRGFNAVYTAGRTNLTLDRIGDRIDALTAGMTETQKAAIWQAGRNAEVNTVTPGVKQLTTKMSTEIQKRQYKMLEEIGKKYGYQFDIVDSIAGGLGNGAYSGGKRIVVAADATEGAIVQAGVHELVHALKRTDADGFEVLKDVVIKHLEESDSWLGLDYAVSERMEQYRSSGQNLTEADAIEEIICEAVPTFMTDEKAVRAFVSKNRTLAEKVRDFFVKFAGEIREIAEKYMLRQGRDEIANLMGRSDALTEIAETFDRALEAAGGGWNATATTGIELSEATKYSVKDKNVIEGYLEAVDPAILEAARMYRDDKNAKFARFRLGDVQTREAQEIKSLLGIDVSGYTHNIDKNAFNHIEKRHGSDGEADHTMADLNDVARISWVLENYDSVERAVDKNGNPVYAKGYLDSDGDPAAVVVYRKRINGVYYVSEAVADNKWKKLWVTTAFMSENKKDASQTPNTSNEAPGHTSENESAAAFDSSISDVAPNVNDQTKFSLNNTAPIESVTDEDAKLMLPQDVDVRDSSIRGHAAAALERGRTERMNQQITGVANKILKETGSTYAKADFIENMKALIREYARDGATEETLRAVSEMAKKIIEGSRQVDNTLREQYADLRKKLRETGISLTETQKQEAANEAGSYDAWRKSLMGTAKIVNEGISLDAIWGELSSQYPEIFPADTGEGEMVGKLTDFMMLMKPKYENPYGMDMDGAALEMAMRIQGDIMGIIGAKDRAKQMYGYAETIRKQAEKEFKAKLAEQKKERVQKFQQIAADLKAAKAKGDAQEQAKVMNRYRAAMKRAALDEAWAEVRATYKAREEQRAENRKANELRGRVVKQAEELEKMFRKPENGKRIPTGLQGLVLDALEMLDINGERAAAAGKETQKAAAFREKLNGIRDFYKQVIDSQSRGEAPEGMDGLMMAFTERNMAAMNEALDILGGGDKFRLREMNSEQLKMLDELLKNIRHTVDSVGKLWKNHRYQSVVELGDASIEEMGERGEHRLRTESAGGRARDFLALDMLEPVSYGERLGEGGQAVIQSLLDGEKEKFSKIREAAAATEQMMKDAGISGYDIGKWRKNVRTVKLGSGKVVKMSDVNIMELYLTAKRPQGLQHLLANGMKMQSSKKTGDQSVKFELTQADITEIGKMLTDKQKKIADLMQKYLSGDAAKWGNDVTQRLYLYDAFTEPTYWPISSDPNSLKTQEPEGERAFTAITNAGFTKPLNAKATNPIIIGDAFDTFNRHIGEMASYAGYAEAMTDTMAWINYRQRSDDGKMTGSVKESIESLLGKGGIQYLTKLLQDINGARRGGDGMQLGKWGGNYKKAAVVGKIRVAMQQPTSIVRAAMEINPFWLVYRAPVGKKTVVEMQVHSSLAWWKSRGNYDMGTGQSTDRIFWGDTRRIDTAIDKAAKIGALGMDPGKLDDKTWAKIWSAVKSETKATRKDLKPGSEEFFRAVTERFEAICDRTQVVDTVMHRSDMMRSKDGLVKNATSFMGEPTKSYNMMARAIMEAGRNPSRESAGKVGRAALVYTASAFVTAAVVAAFDTPKYRDDDEELWDWLLNGTMLEDYKEQLLESFYQNVNPLNSIPLVQDVWDIATSGEIPTVMAFEGVQDIADAAKAVQNYFGKDNTGKRSAYGVIKPLVTAVSSATGLPGSGFLANAEAIAHLLDPELLQTKSNMATTEAAFEKLYEATAKGDKNTALSIRTELAKGMYGKTPKSVKEIDQGLSEQLAINDERILEAWKLRNVDAQYGKLVALYKEIQKDGFTDEMIKRAVNNAQSTMQSRYNALIEEKETEAAEELLKKCAGYGMELETTKEEKDLTEEMNISTYGYKDLYRAVRESSMGDMAAVYEIMKEESEAKDPEQTIRNQISKEFREEYVGLVKDGKTQQAEELSRRLEVFGFDEEDRLEWVKDDYRDNLKAAVEDGEMKEAEKLIETMKEEYEMTDESIASTIRNRFQQDYIDLVVAGKDKEADALAEKLQELGLKYSDGNNRFKQANLNKWVRDWEVANSN